MKYPKTLTILEDREGLFLKPYLDPVKIPTIGLGTIKYPSGRAVTMKDPAITKEQAYEYAIHDIETIRVPAIERLVKVELNENELQALISFVYNVGIGLPKGHKYAPNGSGFHGSTMLELLNAGEPRVVVANEFDRWNKAGGKVLKGLVTRREMEKKLFLTPVATEHNENALPELETPAWFEPFKKIITSILEAIFGKLGNVTPDAPSPEPIAPGPTNLFDKIRFANPALNEDMIRETVKWATHSAVKKRDVLTMLDLDLPSWQDRLFLIDTATGRLVDKSPSAHGSGGDANNNGYCDKVSNVSGSHMSSAGAMVFGENYVSSKRKTGANHAFQISRRIDGLQNGLNNLVRARGIVLHDGFYVTLARMKNKTIGRSQGCIVPTYDFLKAHNAKLQGSLLFVWHKSLKG